MLASGSCLRQGGSTLVSQSTIIRTIDITCLCPRRHFSPGAGPSVGRACIFLYTCQRAVAVGSFVRETYGAQVSQGFTCPAGQLRRCNPLCFVDDRGPWGVGRSLFSFRATVSPSPALIPPEISQKSFTSMKRSRDSSTDWLLRPLPTACT